MAQSLHEGTHTHVQSLRCLSASSSEFHVRTQLIGVKCWEISLEAIFSWRAMGCVCGLVLG